MPDAHECEGTRSGAELRAVVGPPHPLTPTARSCARNTVHSRTAAVKGPTQHSELDSRADTDLLPGHVCRWLQARSSAGLHTLHSRSAVLVTLAPAEQVSVPARCVC